MKKSIVLTAIVLFVSVCSASAQFSFGGGVTAGTKMGVSNSGSDKIGVGLNARAYYQLKEKIDLTAGFSYFFPSAPSGMTMNASQINLDGHYAITKAFYGMAGLNYSFVSASMDVLGIEVSSSDSKLGVDLGAGYKFGKIFVEGKYDTAFEQVALTLGYKF